MIFYGTCFCAWGFLINCTLKLNNRISTAKYIILVELSSSLKPSTSGTLSWNIIYVKRENYDSDMNLLTGAFHLFSRIGGSCLSEGQGLEQ